MTYEDKKMIANFEGLTSLVAGIPSYDTDWNLLHRVISKIEGIKIGGLGVSVLIATKSVTIRSLLTNGVLIQVCELNNHFYDTEEYDKTNTFVKQELQGFTSANAKRAAVGKAIIYFIKWYKNRGK